MTDSPWDWLELHSRARRALAAVAWLVALAVETCILLPVRGDLDGATVALLMLMPPLLASVGGLRVSLPAAGISALAFNVLFLHPYYSLRIRDGAAVASFIVYIAIAGLLAATLDRLRSALSASRTQASEAALIRDLSLDLVRDGVWLGPPINSALAQLVALLGVRGCVLIATIPGEPGIDARAGDAADAETAARDFASSQEGTVRSLRAADGIQIMPIATSDTTFGVLAVDYGTHEPSLSASRLLGSFASVAALAFERTRLTGEAVQRASLEQSDRLRVNLMQAISHDLRTPLTAIAALSAALPSAGPLTESQSELLVDIEAETGRLDHLVSQVLDISRIESGSLRLDAHPLQLEELVRSALSLPSMAALAAHATVSVAPGTPLASADEALVHSVIVNLLDNARRYGGAPYELTIGPSPRGLVELRVIDHGPGIPESERRRIFERGYRAKRPRSRPDRGETPGAGLGLAIGHGFIEAHHGQLRAEPTAGGGATFVLALPAAPGSL